MCIDSLWGEEFTVPKEKEKAKTIAAKIAKPYNAKTSIEKQVKSKVISLKDKLELIEKEVRNKLGKQMNNVLCITSKEDFHAYIDKCIEKGRVAVDTETNNSLDPITCKLMGLCLYTPGEKQAYIPVNHRNPDSKERLNNQLTEKDIAEGLVRLLESKALFETQKGQFDYQVIYHTTGVKIRIDWDTLIAEKLIDENQYRYSLKELYIKQVDPEQEKYSIDSLFEGIEYADVDPEIFALYAATDAMMTSKLADIQREKLHSKEFGNVINLAREIEIPLLPVIGEMESAGMEVDQEYAKLLSAKYHTQLQEVDSEISVELEKLKPMIDAWRLTPDANFRPIKGRTTTRNKIQYKYYEGSNRHGDTPYWYEAETSRKLSDDEVITLNLGVRAQKSKSEQLADPINLGSPTQLAILFYDILGAPTVSKKSPRGTSENELVAISKKIDNPICKLIIKRRELVKLISTYIDVIPELAKRWPDGRVRTHFNPYGAATGRLSSSDPINFQNIPAHNKEIRMLFKASTKLNYIDTDDDIFEVFDYQEVETADGWKYPDLLSAGDILVVNDQPTKITDIRKISNNRYQIMI